MKQHPAAEWASTQAFDTTSVDCTITVVLKILDGKCKMLPGEKAAIFEIYDLIKNEQGEIFNETTHQEIESARHLAEGQVMEKIHEARVYAESCIPKPVMKKYKAWLRDGLFG